MLFIVNLLIFLKCLKKLCPENLIGMKIACLYLVSMKIKQVKLGGKINNGYFRRTNQRSEGNKKLY